MLLLKVILLSSIILKTAQHGSKESKPSNNTDVDMSENQSYLQAQEFMNNALQLSNNINMRLDEYKKIYDSAIGKYCITINIDRTPKVSNIGIFGMYQNNSAYMKRSHTSPKQNSCFNHISNEWNGDSNVKFKNIDNSGFGMIYRATKYNSRDTLIIKQTKATLTYEDKYLIEKNIDEAYFGTNFKNLYPSEEISVVSYYGCCTEIITNRYSVDYNFYFIMDEYKLDSLKSILIDNKYFKIRTNIEWKYKIIYKILNAVEKLHKNQIIHRDIKPDNILMKTIDDPYLSDFGAIKLSDIAKTIIGTPIYEAPEIGRRTYDTKVDIYSLGIVIFEVLNSGFYFRNTFHNDIYYYCNQHNIAPSYDKWGNFVGYPFRYPKNSIEDNESILYCSNHDKLIKK